MLDPVRAKARVIALTGAAFFGGVLLASGMEWTAGSHAATLLQSPPSSTEVRPVAELSEAFVAISESVTPAVVNIQTERTQRLPTNHPGVPEEWRRFFNIPPGGRGGEPIPTQAGGTGFLISEDGYIMTNNHVVEGADKINVILKDRREFSARIIGRDPTTDVAVIKIEGERFPALRMGDPEGTRVGEWVLAIGNPLGLDFTVTAGIVSAKGRPLPIIRETLSQQGAENPGYAIESFIQTDAAINPGNSGGPLVNLRGEVVGVNSAIASNTGYSEGYGFAIPIDLARRVADDLLRYGRVRRPVLGITIQDVTVDDVEAFRLPRVAGVVVQSFTGTDSPARAAGLEQGDVIVAINGQPVDRSNELQRRIASLRPGEEVDVEVIRYGDRKRFRVRLAEAPAPAVAAAPQPEEVPTSEGRLGIRVAPLTAERAQRYGFAQPGGVVVEEASRFGPAGRRGIQPGLKIVRVDREEVSDVQQFERALRGKGPGDVVSLTVADNNGTQQIINIRIPG
jgi:serine protease Do